jgi:exodeoxyribonuclease-3
MRIVTYNINSINARLAVLLAFLRAENPDVVCLQELKCEDAKVPRDAIEDLGYNLITHGQKTYNGVAILSKWPFDDVRRGLPGDETDEQARYIEGVVLAPTPVRVASIYLPNGNPVERVQEKHGSAPDLIRGPDLGPRVKPEDDPNGSVFRPDTRENTKNWTEKFDYKLRWMQRLYTHAQSLLTLEERLVLAGDYNVIPSDADCHDPAAWAGDALAQSESRAAYQRLQWLGLTEAFTAMDGRAHQYTFWDYQAGAWPRNHGIRIDHHLLSSQAADRLTGHRIHRDVRGVEVEGQKPSDHVPVEIELRD